MPVNALSNPGFETDNGGDPIQPTDWVVYPAALTNFATSRTGEEIYGSMDTFTARTGTGALKVYGQYTGNENETPIYQEFNPVTEGDEWQFSGWAYTHSDDRISGSTQAVLSIKYFDQNFTFYGTSDSAVVDAASPGSTWIELTATGNVPAGATLAQASVQYWHCRGDFSGGCYDGGSVYFDDLTFVRLGP